MISKAVRPKQAGQILLIDINRIFPNKNQPRKSFPQEELDLLAESIKRNGIIQPLTVRKKNDTYYELIAGERRLRAAKSARLRSVPCIIMEVNEQNSALISLLENTQRSQLNFAEQAKAIQKLSKYYGMSQEEIARSLGMDRSTVSNFMRILKLSPEALKLLAENGFTQRHARALLKLDENRQTEAAHTVCDKKLSVSLTEKLVEKMLSQDSEVKRKRKIFFSDVRIFINTINHAVETMQSAGIEAKVDRAESEDAYTITVCVPKSKALKNPPQ